MKKNNARSNKRSLIICISSLVLLIAVFCIGESVLCRKTDTLRRETEALVQQNLELESELGRANDELAFVKSDAGIELYARANGMQMSKNETRYTTGR